MPTVHIPSDDELDVWTPDPAHKRTRITFDINTGVSGESELPLGTRPYDWATNPSYRSRYKAKMLSQAAQEAANLAAQQKEADRQSGALKLKGLGLTESEIEALRG